MGFRKNKYLIFVFTLILFFFGGAIFQYIPIKILNLDIDKLSQPQNIYLSLFSNLAILVILFILNFDDLKKDFMEFKDNFYIIFDKSFQIWVIGLVLMAVFNIVINYFSPNEIANNEEAIREMIKVKPIIMLLSTSIIAPFIEELVFRKAFRDIFSDAIIFILSSGIVFGAMHVVLSVENVYDYLYLLPYCSLGLAFSYIYYKTNNIFSSILMHMIHNFILTVISIISIGMIIW